MNVAAHRVEGNAKVPVLYMALELSDKTWKVVFGDGVRRRQVAVPAADLAKLACAVAKAKERFEMPASARVVSCYEAGRDGFWLHRHLRGVGIENEVVDSSSIEVSRRLRRAKTDRLDGDRLLAKLVRYHAGEREGWSVLRVPGIEDEDARRLHRELARLKRERLAHRCRIQSLLVIHGVRAKVNATIGARLEALTLWDGSALPPELKRELEREAQRLGMVHSQIAQLEATRRERLREPRTASERRVVQLMGLGAIGPSSAWLLVMEFFGWRGFRNRREVAAAAGLVGTPYNSGEVERDQGISKAGNRRVRAMMVEIAWLWLRFQPQSDLAKWYQARFAGGGLRMRRVGIVALARRLLIALWRYLEHGVIPEGARMIQSQI
jgi:transposase